MGFKFNRLSQEIRLEVTKSKPSLKNIEKFSKEIKINSQYKGWDKGKLISLGRTLGTLKKDVKKLNSKQFWDKYTQYDKLSKLGFGALRIDDVVPYSVNKLVDRRTRMGKRLKNMSAGKNASDIGITSATLQEIDEIIGNMGGWFLANVKYREDVDRILGDRDVNRDWYQSRWLRNVKQEWLKEREDVKNFLKTKKKVKNKDIDKELEKELKKLYEKI